MKSRLFYPLIRFLAEHSWTKPENLFPGFPTLEQNLALTDDSRDHDYNQTVTSTETLYSTATERRELYSVSNGREKAMA